MTQMENLAEPRIAPTGLLASGLERIALMIAAAKLRRQTAATRQLLQELTPEQLQDIGYPKPLLPQITVKAGLVTTLMSMR